MSDSKRSSSKTSNDNDLSKSPPNSNKDSRRSTDNEEQQSTDAAAPKKEEANILSKSPVDSDGAVIETAQTAAVTASALSSKRASTTDNTESDSAAQSSPGNARSSSPKRVSMADTPPRSPRRSIDKNVVADAALETAEQHSTKRCRLEYFRSGTDADCEVHVPRNGEQEGGNVCYKKFRCHRIFLATASAKLEQDVFQNKQWNGILQINGVSPESVEIFLEYIYTFEVTSALVDLRIIGDIYILSTAYNMPELLQTFSKRLKDVDWPLDDIFPAFNLAFQHNLPDLENACVEKILNLAEELKTQSSIMKLQIYAFNYLIQYWMVTEAVATNELIQLLQQYQRENDLNFKNTKQFPHFTKIVKYFSNVLLDAEGLIYVS
ncbi:hypothetical protein ACLKA6_016524 [Drosophila palustris]